MFVGPPFRAVPDAPEAFADTIIEVAMSLRREHGPGAHGGLRNMVEAFARE